MKCDLLRAFVCALSLGAILSSPARAHGDGATIFPATLDGRPVKRHKFDSKCAVYLAMSPGRFAHRKAKRLPRGDYYFQVTDVTGKELLSTDPVENRRFQVAQGVIVSHAGTHPTGADQNNRKQKGITIGLAGPNCPGDFLDAPGKWGAYKVWITPVDEYREPARCRRRCYHGFVPFESKTATFRVKPSAPPPPEPPDACLTVRKEFAPGEGAPFIPFAGWEMTISDPLGTDNVLETDENGEVEVCDLVDGPYVVREELRPDSQVVGLKVNDLDLLPDSVYSFSWDASRGSMLVVFQNQGF